MSQTFFVSSPINFPAHGSDKLPYCAGHLYEKSVNGDFWKCVKCDSEILMKDLALLGKDEPPCSGA